MTPEEKLNELAESFRDIANYFEWACEEFRTVAARIERPVEIDAHLDISPGEEKQRRVRESRREDAIDELLRREGFSW